jgi:hypothetical protein
MVRPLPKVLILLFVISCCSSVAFADLIGVGQLTFDALPNATFDILNLTGGNSFPPDFPITTQLTITVTSLVANLQVGGPITILGSDFTPDAQGDLACLAPGDAGTGGCDFSAYNIVSAVLTGTLSPLTPLGGLPAGDTSILSTFTTTITPTGACGLNGVPGTTLTANCDYADINATGVNPSAVPEPATWILLSTALIGLMMGYKVRGRAEETGAA